jgi:hypothetical protein
MFKCLQHFKPWYRNTLETYIASSIRSNVYGKISDQFKRPKDKSNNKCTEVYFTASLSEPVHNEDGDRELVDIIVDDRLPGEPRLDAVILSDGLLSMLDQETRGIIEEWRDGMPYTTIYESRGMTLMQVRYRISRGIDRLREIVDNQGKQ